MKTICVTALSVMLVTAFCGGAFGAEYCRPTGELQEKSQTLADLAVREGMQGALQFCAFKDGKCIVDVWAGTMTTNAGAAKKDDVNIQDLQMATVAKGNAASAGSVASFCERAKKGDRLTVAFLGGSRKEEWFSWRLVRTWEGRSEEHLN